MEIRILLFLWGGGYCYYHAAQPRPPTQKFRPTFKNLITRNYIRVVYPVFMRVTDDNDQQPIRKLLIYLRFYKGLCPIATMTIVQSCKMLIRLVFD